MNGLNVLPQTPSVKQSDNLNVLGSNGFNLGIENKDFAALFENLLLLKQEKEEGQTTEEDFLNSLELGIQGLFLTNPAGKEANSGIKMGHGTDQCVTNVFWGIKETTKTPVNAIGQLIKFLAQEDLQTGMMNASLEKGDIPQTELDQYKLDIIKLLQDLNGKLEYISRPSVPATMMQAVAAAKVYESGFSKITTDLTDSLKLLPKESMIVNESETSKDPVLISKETIVPREFIPTAFMTAVRPKAFLNPSVANNQGMNQENNTKFVAAVTTQTTAPFALTSMFKSINTKPNEENQVINQLASVTSEQDKQISSIKNNSVYQRPTLLAAVSQIPNSNTEAIIGKSTNNSLANLDQSLDIEKRNNIKVNKNGDAANLSKIFETNSKQSQDINIENDEMVLKSIKDKSTDEPMLMTKESDGLKASSLSTTEKTSTSSLVHQITQALHREVEGLSNTASLRQLRQINQVEIQLNPAELGKIRVSVRLEDGQVHLFMHATENSTGSLLQQQLGELRQNLTNMGVVCGSFDMGLGERQENSQGFQDNRHSQNAKYLQKEASDESTNTEFLIYNEVINGDSTLNVTA